MKKDIPKQPTANDRPMETRPRTLSLFGASQHCPGAQARAVTTENKAEAVRIRNRRDPASVLAA